MLGFESHISIKTNTLTHTQHYSAKDNVCAYKYALQKYKHAGQNVPVTTFMRMTNSWVKQSNYKTGYHVSSLPSLHVTKGSQD